jgi:long-subunit acyl-CoA synthetase (AMP-forming)
VAVVLPKKPDDPAAKVRIQQFVDKNTEQRPSFAVRRVIFTDLAFSRENGFLRPNLKLDRNRIAQHFKIGAMEAGSAVGRTA